jgi:hypothetical protein
MAQLALFGVVVGIALLLSGFGLGRPWRHHQSSRLARSPGT